MNRREQANLDAVYVPIAGCALSAPPGSGYIVWQQSLSDLSHKNAHVAFRLPAGFGPLPKFEDQICAIMGFVGQKAGDSAEAPHYPVVFLGVRVDFTKNRRAWAYVALNPVDPAHRRVMDQIVQGPDILGLQLVGSRPEKYLLSGMPIPAGHRIKLQQILDAIDAYKLPSAPDFEFFAQHVYRNSYENSLKKLLFEL